MNCEFCQSPVHIWFDCPKKPNGCKPARLAKKSAASRKDENAMNLHEAAAVATKTVDSGEADGAAGVAITRKVVSRVRSSDPAGTQALPVDTSRVRKKALAGEVPSVNEHPETEGKLVQVLQSHSANKFDKKAWMREYMRGYMRKRRAKNV